MAIKLNGSTSGSVALDAPADTSPSGTDVTLTLPTSAGSSGQYLQTNGSGVLSWQTVATPNVAFESYAIICDQKASYADGGTFTSGAWRTRDLNTEIDDPDGIVTIASNQFTLGAGSYLIRWSAPAYYVSGHQTRLYDVTNTAALQVGSSAHTNANTSSTSSGSDRVTITANTTYEIQHRCSVTQATIGFGLGASGGPTWGDSLFTIVEIFREA